MKSSSERFSKFGSSNSRERKYAKEEEQNRESIKDKTQISVRKYYQGTDNYKILIKIKMVPYESKLNNAFLSIENIDLKTIVLRNKPDILKITNRVELTRDISSLQKDKVQTFDWVFGDNENSEFITLKSFSQCAQQLLKGYNQSLILYGGANSDEQQQQNLLSKRAIGSLRDPGLFILLIKEVLFNRIELEEKGIDVKIKISVCQFDKDIFYDCIVGHSTPLEVHEDSQKQLYIAGLYQAEVSNLIQALRIIKIAQLHLQKYEQNIDKSKQLLKSTNIIFEIKCIQEDIKDIERKQIVSCLKLVKLEQDTFNEAIRGGAQNSVLSPLNNCIRQISEINQKTRKSNNIPYKSHKLIEYLRDCIGGNSQTYLIGCANPLAEHVQDTEAMIRHLNMARSITTTPEIMKYSNSKQEYQLEQYQKSIKDNIEGLITELFGEKGMMSRNQQQRLQTVGNILSKIQQLLNKLIRIYSEVQECQSQLHVIYQQIVDSMSKAYTKCITSSDVKEFYIGKLQQYHIDSFKENNSAHYSIIQMLLNKLYKSKMKAEIWEFQLVQHLKLNELRESKPEDLQSKDIERLVQISKQSKKLYQYYNEQVCLSQFDSIKSKELLNTLFHEINQIKTIYNATQIPTLQQINSSQFIEIRNRNSSLSGKSIEASISQNSEGRSTKELFSNQKSTSLAHQLSTFGGNTNKNQIPSIFQHQKNDYNFENASHHAENENTHSSGINTARIKNQKSQFLIMNMMGQDNEDYQESQGNSSNMSRDNISESSLKVVQTNRGEFNEDQDEYEENNVNNEMNMEDKILDIRKLQQKYVNLKKKGGDQTKLIYVNNKKIEVKKVNNHHSRKQSSGQQFQQQYDSFTKSQIVSGGDSLIINQQEKQKNNININNNQESMNIMNTHNQLLSQDQSLISQIAFNYKGNETVLKDLIGTDIIRINQIDLNQTGKYSSINQLLQFANQSELNSHRISQSSNNNHSPNNISYLGIADEQDYLIQNSMNNNNNKDVSKGKISVQNQSQYKHLPYLSQLLENQVNIQNKQSPLEYKPQAHSYAISLNPSNQASMLGQSIQSNPLQLNSQRNQQISQEETSKNKIPQNYNKPLYISNKLELDDELMYDIFQKSKLNSFSVNQQQTRNNIFKTTNGDHKTDIPRNLSSLNLKKNKTHSMTQIRERTNKNLNQIQQKSPHYRLNGIPKKLSLINLRGYQNQDNELEGKQIGYFRTHLNESHNPPPKNEYFQELLTRYSQKLKINQTNQTTKQVGEEDPTSLFFNQYEQTNKSISLHEKKLVIKGTAKVQIHENDSNLKKNTKTIHLSKEKEIQPTLQNNRQKIKEQLQKDQISFKLPNINETLHHRSKYTKFFLN